MYIPLCVLWGRNKGWLLTHQHTSALNLSCHNSFPKRLTLLGARSRLCTGWERICGQGVYSIWGCAVYSSPYQFTGNRECGRLQHIWHLKGTILVSCLSVCRASSVSHVHLCSLCVCSIYVVSPSHHTTQYVSASTTSGHWKSTLVENIFGIMVRWKLNCTDECKHSLYSPWELSRWCRWDISQLLWHAATLFRRSLDVICCTTFIFYRHVAVFKHI
jgi:hypothetical protein